MLCFVLAVSFVCLSVSVCCVSGSCVCVCAFSTLRLVSVYSCAGIFVLLCAYVFFVFFPSSEFCEVVAGVYSNENACFSFSPLFSH